MKEVLKAMNFRLKSLKDQYNIFSKDWSTMNSAQYTLERIDELESLRDFIKSKIKGKTK